MDTVKWKNLLVTASVLALGLTACAPSSNAATEPAPGATEAGAQVTQPPASTEPAPPASGSVVISASDPCSLLTKEQVEAGFSKSVTETTPQQENIGLECEYTFGEDTDLRVTFYQGAQADNFFAVLITAGRQSCDEFFESMFDVAFAPLMEKYPSADASPLDLPLSDLYQQYLGVLGQCMYIHTENRNDAGDNVVASETIFLNASSNVAVLSPERVVSNSPIRSRCLKMSNRRFLRARTRKASMPSQIPTASKP